MLSRLKESAVDVDRGWPGYLFGGRMRTSTLVLIVAFVALWWVYDDHRESTASDAYAGTGHPGGAARLCSRPELHLGAAHPGAATANHDG